MTSRSITYQTAFAALSGEYARYQWAALRYTLFLLGEAGYRAALKRWSDAWAAFRPHIQAK